MKSKDLIALLLAEDPTGETQVCIDNADIQDITREAAYWDGSLNVIDFDDCRRPVKGRRVRTGEKLRISPIGIYDALEYEDFKVEYLTEEDRNRYEHLDIKHVARDGEMNIRLDREAFASWVFERVQLIRPVALTWVGRITEAANKFYDEIGMTPENPNIFVRPQKSYNDCREEFWVDTFDVDWDNYSRIIITLRPERSNDSGFIPQ